MLVYGCASKSNGIDGTTYIRCSTMDVYRKRRKRRMLRVVGRNSRFWLDRYYWMWELHNTIRYAEISVLCALWEWWWQHGRAWCNISHGATLFRAVPHCTSASCILGKTFCSTADEWFSSIGWSLWACLWVLVMGTIFSVLAAIFGGHQQPTRPFLMNSSQIETYDAEGEIISIWIK